MFHWGSVKEAGKYKMQWEVYDEIYHLSEKLHQLVLEKHGLDQFPI